MAEQTSKFKIRKNDLVVVVAGKDRGKTGRVVRVLPERERLVVEGVNMVHRHVRGQPGVPGRIVEKEAPLHLSNVALWNAAEKRRVKVGWRLLEDGRKVRVDRKTGQPIDTP